MEIQQIAQRISEKFSALGHQVEITKIEEKLNRMIGEFGIPQEEAERSIVSDYSREFGIDTPVPVETPEADSSDATPIADVHSGDWTTLEGVVTHLFESRSPSVAQSGTLADKSGTIRITVWAKSQAPTLETGKWYRIENAAIDEFNNQLNMQVHAGTNIIPLTEENLPDNLPQSISELNKGLVSIEGKIVALTRRTEGPVAVEGVIADATGALRFSIRQSEIHAEINEGKWYRFDYASADYYKGALNLQINTGTKVTEIQEDRSLRPSITPISGIKPGIVCIRAKVLQEYDSSSERMFQSGILGDETGTIRFVTWNNEGAERLTVGTVYTIFYAASDEYNNRLSLTLNGSTCLADDTATINVSALPERRASEFITLEGQVTVIFPPRSASIAQSGVLAHKSGTIRFTIWANLNAPTLETGKWYRFENALTDEYNSQQNLKINAGTKIIPISEELIPDCSHTPIGEIKPGIICTEGKIISLQSITTGTLKAAGVLADETGAIRFTIRLDEIASEIIQGSWYRFSAAIADFYRGSINLQFNTGTKIELLPDKPEMHPQITNVGELKNGIVSLRVKVVQEWEGSGDRMLQSGIVGDETGTVRFVTWKDDTATKLLPGKIYYLHYASVDEFNGKHNLNLNGALIIPDESGIIDVKRTGDEITGALVHISPGSGLIKRCPIEGCGRALTRQNYCQVHEIQPKFQYDLRIKGWLDNGRQTWDTIISREGVENLIGLTLEGAQEMAENNPLGLETVYYHMCEKLLGRYLKCQGRVIDNRLFSTTCEYLTFDPTRHADLINRTEVINHE